jgi:flagellar hook-associated protein 1
MSLLGTLTSASSGLRVVEHALNLSQNNVTNAATPGYAKQRATLQALPFDPPDVTGGVTFGDPQSSRNAFAEEGVWRQVELLGHAEQKATNLSAIENGLDVSGQGGISAALNLLYQSFSSWSVDPNGIPARDAVLAAASKVSQAFQEADGALTRVTQGTERELTEVVSQINYLAGKLRDFNVERRTGAQHDAGLDAKIHSTLEQLSELADFKVSFQPDGSLSVLLGGQTALVVGEHSYPVTFETFSPTSPAPTYVSGPRSARLMAEGRDVTAQVTKGKLGALLEVYNQTLPSLRGNAYQQGDLNLLAKTVADRVNTIMTSGRISDGPPVVPGVALFTYDAANPTASAFTLNVNPAITSPQLAAIDPGPPYVSNGIPLRLAKLASPDLAADKINGLSYSQFYGNVTARIGRDLNSIRDARDVQSLRTAQARSLREQLSGVSLDEEAVHMVEFQRAYQATAEMIRILNDLTGVAINMLR